LLAGEEWLCAVARGKFCPVEKIKSVETRNMKKVDDEHLV